MHFSIPDTQELYVDPKSATSTYTVYNIFVNGNYHTSLRFKALHALHEQLRRLCAFEPEIQLPAFPKKRLLPLTNGQLETRRAALENYLQVIGQDTRIARLAYFQQYLLRAQIDTALAEFAIESDSVCEKVTVMLPNGGSVESVNDSRYQLQVNCCVNQNTSVLLRSVGHALKLPPALLQYFCLYLGRNQRITDVDGEEVDTLVLVRRLMDFESPFISRLHSQPCHFILRKAYWNPLCDVKLQNDPVALNLLYLQTVSDFAREWIIVISPDVRHKLRSLQEHGMKKEYIEVAREMPLYGYLHFNSCVVDYPEAETNAIIAIGNGELSIRTPTRERVYETKFRVTRMRCWRVSAMHNTFESRDQPTHLQLSFEYLMCKGTLRWITITSTDAMLMSVCLQSMVDELLHYGEGNESSNDEARNGRTSATSSSTSSTPCSSTSATSSTCTPCTPSTSSSSVSSNYYLSSSNSQQTTPASPTPPVRFLAQRRNSKHKLTTSNIFSAVFFRNSNNANIQNKAFEGIGDADL